MLLTARRRTRRDLGHLGNWSGNGGSMLEDRCFIYAIWMVRRLVSSWMIRKTHFKTVEQRSIVGNDLFRLLITNRWSLIEGPRTRTVLFNVPKRTETENLKMQREWSSLCVAVDWGSGRDVDCGSNNLLLPFCSLFLFSAVDLLLLLGETRQRSSRILSSFAFLLIWRVSKPRRPRAKFA